MLVKIAKIFHLRKSTDPRLVISSRQTFLDRNRNLNLSTIEEETKMSDLDKIYKALRLVPEFDGNPNVLTRFLKLCDQLVVEFCGQASNELSKCALINGILNKITGSAARLINSNGISCDWQGIRSSLVNNFADQRDETALYNDLAILSQGSSSAQEFYERCQNLYSTIMTYVSLHDTVQTTIDAKRDLYRKLTLQAYVRGLNDPLGSRIRCMRPETIEKALEFVHDETNTIYLQNRNQRLPDKKVINSMHVPNHFVSGFKIPNQSFSTPTFKPINYSTPGPSRPQMIPPSAPQLRQNFYQPRQFGPTRTQQIFRALPPNYNPQHSNFQMNSRPNPQTGNNQPRPMSGVSHFVTRPLPPTQSAFTGHNWQKSGNPPPTNYFKSKEVNYNNCTDDSYYVEYTDYYEPYYDNYEYVDYQQPYENSLQERIEYPTETPHVEVDSVKCKEQDFSGDQQSDTLK